MWREVEHIGQVLTCVFYFPSTALDWWCISTDGENPTKVMQIPGPLLSTILSFSIDSILSFSEEVSLTIIATRAWINKTTGCIINPCLNFNRLFIPIAAGLRTWISNYIPQNNVEGDCFPPSGAWDVKRSRSRPLHASYSNQLHYHSHDKHDRLQIYTIYNILSKYGEL